MALLNLVGELTGTLPGLSPLLARNYINRALTSIYDEREWSFLSADGVLICPGQLNTGTAALVQYTATVTLDAVASAALQDQITGATLPGVLNLQFRPTATPPAASQLYGIISVDNTVPAAVVLTLDRAIVEATNATSEYSIYRALFTPPVADFKSWESFVDPGNALTLLGNKINVSSQSFDARDPQRTATGLSYYVGGWGSARDNGSGTNIPISTATLGQPIYEFWPHPTTGQTWYVRIRRKGTTLTAPTDSQQPGIPDNLIIQRALYEHAYPFAAANAANFPAFKQGAATWGMLITTSKSNYVKELQDTKRVDMDKQLQSTDVWNRGHGLRSVIPFGRDNPPGYPIDSAFLQSHLIRW